MKQSLVKFLRQLLPKAALRPIEDVYRRTRVWLVSAAFGFPAKSLKIVAITGTNGKTTTANYLNEIFKAAGQKTAMFTTAVIELDGVARLNDLNATVALTSEMQRFFKQAKAANVDRVILEVTSHALAQHKLAGVPIEAAVMTNLTQDHLDWHGTMENYAAAKGKLFANEPKFMVLNSDDEWFEYFNQFVADQQKITYGANDDAECRIVGANLHRAGTDMKFLIDNQTKLECGTVLPGKFNVYNAAAAISTAYVLHIDLAHIKQGIENLNGVPGRQEKVEVSKPYEVIIDYAHTPDALEQLLQSLRSFTKSRLILVFGATGDRDKAKRPIMGEIAAKLADRIVLTDDETYGENGDTIRAEVMEGIKAARGEGKTDEIGNRREAIAKALKIARKGDIVVITGMGHEQFMIVNGEKIPWNDGEVVKELAS